MIQPTLLEKLQALPESLQIQVSQYIDLLLAKHPKITPQNPNLLHQELQQLTPAEAEKRYGYGSMAGQITMADDFDDPLIDIEISKTLAQLPEPLKQEVLNHARQLLENHSKSNPVDGHEKKRRSGILKGTFVLPLPDDFDDPLEDFADYQ